MKIEVRATNIELTKQMKRSAERRVLFALNRFSTRIQQVTIVLTDVNGPRGGEDTSCRLTVVGREGWVVTLTTLDHTPLMATTLVASRAARAVGRQLERQRAAPRAGRRARAS